MSINKKKELLKQVSDQVKQALTSCKASMNDS